MKKIIVRLFVCVIICLILYKIALFVFPRSYGQVKKIYHSNKAELEYVCDAIYNFDSESVEIELFDSSKSINIYKNDGSESESNNESIKITDEKLIEYLKTLKSNDFIRVKKEYGYVFCDIGCLSGSSGIIYSPEKEPDVSSQNVIRQTLQKIDNTDFYYYCAEYDN